VEPQVPCALRSGRDDKSYLVQDLVACHTTNLVIPTGADPDFLLRGTTNGRVCGFP
jgi:hypothetical protein